ncbi:MAG: porin family protein [Bacteroidota bacterium]
MMRLIAILFITISLLKITLLSAQEKKSAPLGQRYSIGIKAGPSVTLGVYPDKDQRDQFTAEPKLGFGGAFFINFPLKNDYSYLAEAGYSVKGRRVKLSNGDFVNDQTFQFVEMSMALRRSFDLRLVKNIPSRWFINLGPNIGYWVSGKGKFVETKYTIKFNVPPDGDLYTNYLTNPNRWLFGIDVGIGADAPINRKQKVRLELRATLGQTYLGKKNSGSSYATLSWEDTLKTNLKTLSLTAAYTLDFDSRAMKMGKSTKNKEIKKRR